MSDTNLWSDYLKTILLLAGIVLAAWAVVRYCVPKTAAFRDRTAGPIRVVARYALEPKKSLYVVELGAEYFLLGSAENSLRTLAKLDAAGLEQWLASRPAAEAKPDFRSLLKGWKRP